MTAQQSEIQPGQWVVNVNGKQKGPYSIGQLQKMAAEGHLPPAAAVWTPGMAQWQHWQRVPELGSTGGGDGTTGGSLPAPSRGTVMDFLVFRRMLTPILIQVYFWLGVSVFALWGLWSIIEAISSDSILWMLFGLLIMTIPPLFWRVLCEIVILAFRINETLTDIRNQTR